MAENKIRENTIKPKPMPKKAEEVPASITEEEPKKGAEDKDKKKQKKKEKDVQEKKERQPREKDPRIGYAIGFLLLCLALFFALAIISYLTNYFSSFDETGNIRDNVTGHVGSILAKALVKDSFGIGSLFFPYLFCVIGLYFTLGNKIKIWNIWKHAIMSLAWFPLLFAFINAFAPNNLCKIFGGAVGKFLQDNIDNFLGPSGVVLILVFVLLLYLLFQYNLNIETIRKWRERRADKKALRRKQRELKRQQQQQQDDPNGNDDSDDIDESDDEDDSDGEQENNNKKENVIKNDGNDEKDDRDNDDTEEIDPSIFDDDDLPPITVIHRSPENTQKNDPEKNKVSGTNTPLEIVNPVETATLTPPEAIKPEPTKTVNPEPTETIKPESAESVKLEIEQTPDEKTVKDGKEHHTIDTPFDPHYELSDFKFPGLDLLNDYGDKRAEVSNEELEANKNKIVETLGNYGIQIDKIKATIGPTVTLYEIVPAAGVRISKIKNLEDDIALSLAALGIRIIAPIPGKGTIGIEVPNKKPETVSMKSVLASEKFQNNKFALPCAIGKTISNETYVFDLAKMPHILMAGATGQGKSVGLNAIIASLLYSKHPSDLKFIMVDPKKVELTLYNRIERHYLAKLPDSEDAIITDVKKVVRTLNSLCIEMDQRYDLLKAAQCRNIIEYNEKFKTRRLLPTEGHRYLPYIVLVVDEFADLIMTAGREVESPIARLAQLARAIGIHLIIATQRPSVNIITGSIKANFPARIAFRVISQVDSKTILDQSGANQLIGRGDMLLSTGNDLVRLQCAFIDTPEVESITTFIGEQRGFSQPFLLPEVPDEENGEGADIEDDNERDPLFEDAARIVVQTQQGSTSMIQRKLKLGYNRAGRIIDQLEAAGIVGAFSGSKSREVKVANEFALEQILKDLELKDQGI